MGILSNKIMGSVNNRLNRVSGKSNKHRNEGNEVKENGGFQKIT